MARQHQVVFCDQNIFPTNTIPFMTALDKRNKLIQIKEELKKELEESEKKIRGLTESIENSCDHKWCNKTDYSSGEKEKWSYCEICGKISGGHQRNFEIR